MRHSQLILVGFGSVGRAFARLLLRKGAVLRSDFGFTFQVNGIITGRHGAAIDSYGLDLTRVLAVVDGGGSLDALSAQPAPRDTLEFIRACPGNVLFENTPVNHHSGQPALDYLRAALELGMHAVTANKGPVVHGYHKLSALAAQKGVRFLFESAVMDGAPIFSLFRGPLPAAELQGFHGILNSTSNLILEQMEQGQTFDDAVAYCQRAGLAETDPSADIDGWDAAIKVCALANVLMGAELLPALIEREGIRAITPEQIAQARAAGERWKLVCAARRAGGVLQASVSPQRVSPDSRLYAINGSSSYVEFALDVLPGLGIIESDPGPETTAYGLLADLINALRGD
jgi:homoserine dehydrogenase